MAIETMERKAADNKYLHREFHNFFNLGLTYTKEHFGEEGVREYLTVFTKNFYAPLIEEIKKDGLSAMEAHLKKIYEIEEASDVLHTKLSGGRLEVTVDKCPGVSFIRGTNRPVSDMYSLSSTVVFDVIAKESGLKYECISYDEETGAAKHLFTKEA